MASEHSNSRSLTSTVNNSCNHQK